jgi:hypothetical protein
MPQAAIKFFFLSNPNWPQPPPITKGRSARFGFSFPAFRMLLFWMGI